MRRLLTPLLALVSLASSFTAFEYAGAMVLRHNLGAEYTVDVDHRLKPNRRRGINRDGIRSLREADAFRETSYNVIFLGDSFTFGVYVPSDEAFPSLVEHQLAKRWPTAEVTVANFGWPSSSPILSFRLLRDIGARYRPDLVILCLDMTDFHDDLTYQRLLAEGTSRMSPTRFLYKRIGGPHAMEWLRDFFHLPAADGPPRERFFAMKQPLPASRRWLAVTEEHVGRIAHFARQSLGADFVLVMLPRPFQYNPAESPDNWEAAEYDAHSPYARIPFAWLDELAARADYPVLSLLSDFEKSGMFPTAFRHDPHWNAAGHEVAAQAISRSVANLAKDGRLRQPGR